jgi:hypothetical protein
VTILADILTATAKTPPMVLGIRMAPFTVGHAILLHRMGSPFVVGGDATAQDLVEAAVICSQEPRESIKAMRSIIGWIPLRLMRSRVTKANLAAECATMQQWLTDQSDCPEVLQTPGVKSKQAAMPWPERILVGLVSIGFNEQDVLSMPVIDAERLFLTHAEMEGKVELWGDKQEALWRYGQQLSTRN